MGLVSLINRLQQKKFIGGKKDSLMQARVSNKIKLVNGPRIKRLACGAHGNIFDLIAYKGSHKTKLVIKRYHSGNQSATAKEEFKILTSLRAKGYPTPPTFRLVRINGKYYIAMTDLIPELKKDSRPIKSLYQLIIILFGIGIMMWIKFMFE